jgi:cell division protein FtsW
MFMRLLACGMVTMIVTQALLNIAVVAGAVPATGLPLPFFSAGGSSLIVTLAMSGLILNVSRTGSLDANDAYLKQGVYYD